MNFIIELGPWCLAILFAAYGGYLFGHRRGEDGAYWRGYRDAAEDYTADPDVPVPYSIADRGAGTPSSARVFTVPLSDGREADICSVCCPNGVAPHRGLRCCDHGRLVPNTPDGS